jgi:hypothetical protein
VPEGLQSQDGTAADLLGHTPPLQTPEGLPYWDTAHSTFIPTIRHINKAALEDRARVLEAEVGDVCANPSDPRWGL